MFGSRSVRESVLPLLGSVAFTHHATREKSDFTCIVQVADGGRDSGLSEWPQGRGLLT